MTREELEAIINDDRSSELTKVVAESALKDLRIKELEQIVAHKGCVEFVERVVLNGDERLKNRMAFLLGFTPCEMSVEKFKQDHKLEREQMEARIKELEGKLAMKLDTALYPSCNDCEHCKPKWISVKDRLPNKTCDCFEYFPEHNFVLLGQWFDSHGCFSGFLHPSHWAEVKLPPPPKSED